LDGVLPNLSDGLVHILRHSPFTGVLPPWFLDACDGAWMSSIDAWFVESHSSHSRVTLRNCNFFGGVGLFPGSP
jgi:hypothetical protein